MTTYRLYKAVKHQAINYEAEHGYSLPELWAIVRNASKGEENQRCWSNICINVYEREVENPEPLPPFSYNWNSCLRSRNLLIHIPKRFRKEK